MLPVVVGVAPLLVGMFVILLLARYAPNVPQTPPLGASGIADARPEITSDEFKDVVVDLVDALGLHTVFSTQGTGGVIEMTLRDTRPLSGGRILLFATPVLSEQINSVEALGFAEGVRGDMGALKGIMIALAGFTDEARTSIGASPAPVELIDGAGLLELVRDHLSVDRAESVGEYRGFGADLHS
jgi:restriction endonuclease Mrr